MRALPSLALCFVFAGWLPAAAETLAGKTVIVERTGDRMVPVRLGDGFEAGSFVATMDGSRSAFPVTVADGDAWLTLGRLPAGPQKLSIKPRPAGTPHFVRLEKHDDADAIDVQLGEGLFTTYHYSNEERKPYLWPLKGEGDVSMTRDWPMGERAESGDHPHHVSFWTGFGEIDESDYWEYGDRTGWQRTESIDFGSGDAFGWITTHIVWEDKDHEPVIDEHRAYRFFNAPPDGQVRLFDVRVNFTASYGDVKFGDTKEGGMVSLRIADALRERGGSGTITTSAGAVGEKAAWGKPAAWCDYSGTIDGVGARGIAIFDSPSSFRHPTHWHVRDYGLMGANAFGYSYFYNGAKNGDHTVEQGGTLSFSYRIYVHSGDVTEADVAGYYEDFANPPVVTVE